mgnify:FL=1
MNRALSPVVGTLLLVAVTVAIAAVLAATVGTAALGPVATDGGATTTFTKLSLEATADGEVTLTHEAGDSIDVGDVTVTVRVDGTPLSDQPPVPFFSAAGFEPGPTGPFNSAADPTWTVGESASFTIDAENTPSPQPGEELVVTVTRDGRQIARASTSVLGNDAD